MKCVGCVERLSLGLRNLFSAWLAPGDIEDNLATLTPGRDPLERRPRALERERRVHRGPQLASVGKARELAELLAVRLDDEVVRARRLDCDGDDPAGGRQAPAHGVEDEVCRPVLDDIGARVPSELHGELADPAAGTRY